jgi:hypothetical protein
VWSESCEAPEEYVVNILLPPLVGNFRFEPLLIYTERGGRGCLHLISDGTTVRNRNRNIHSKEYGERNLLKG